MNAKKYPVTDNKSKERYEMPVDHYLCFIDYMRPEKGIVCLTHTDIPRAIQNQGYGTILVEEVLRMIEKGGDKVVPICGFVAGYIERHPHWMSLVADGIEAV
jgi:predicted GNAT family acetyltransferase